jgi:hypothetical protein
MREELNSLDARVQGHASIVSRIRRPIPVMQLQYFVFDLHEHTVELLMNPLMAHTDQRRLQMVLNALSPF